MSQPTEQQVYEPLSWLSLSCTPQAVFSELRVQKTIHLYPLKLRFSGILDCYDVKLRGEVTVKERLLGGTLQYRPCCRTLEYRKRFHLLGGLLASHVWGAWDVSRPAAFLHSAAAWKPKVGCGLTLDEAHGLTRRLLRPLSFSHKWVVPLTRNVCIKAYSESTIKLPKKLSLWAESDGALGVNDFELSDAGSAAGDEGGFGAGAGLLINLQRTALVVEV